ncbi:MAG: hypothetical protein ACRDQB_07415, partial [Thermocrispum sp.]
AGTWIQIDTVNTHTEPSQRVHNLTIADDHTYHTAIAGVDVLGHNQGNGDSCDISGWRGTNVSKEDSFDYHYAKHGNNVSREQYARDATQWADNPVGSRTSVTLRDGSPGWRYRTPGGGPGGILDQGGNIITFWYQ